MKPEVVLQLDKLQAKYDQDGQDLASMLAGLHLSDYISYWDYIQLDTLLTLQKPRTKIVDEPIFIMYHQITELYFKLSLHELEPLATRKVKATKEELVRRVKRVNRYFEALSNSFHIMADGMERSQFLAFRMALIPASGFQSAQYRLIEFASTALENLVKVEVRAQVNEQNPDAQTLYENIYWMQGATVEESGEKTLTLKQFEAKYTPLFMEKALAWRHSNLSMLWHELSAEDQQDKVLIEALRALDYQVNVDWPLQHYRTAAQYLARQPDDAAATGGTNWRNYLPPRFQKRIFFPFLWSEQEQSEWGKKWVTQQTGGLSEE